MICVYIGMVNVVLDLNCIILKNMLETINYNKVNPVIYLTIKLTFSFIKSLEFREILFVVHILLKANSQ